MMLLVIAFLFIAALLLPTFDVNKRQRAKEAVAASRLRTINKLQHQFAAEHPGAGYSCHLSQLKSSHPLNNDYDPEAFLATGEQSGYRFVLLDCRAEPNGVVSHYRVAAVPMEPTDSGFRFLAFCIDDSGAFRYDVSGSAENCIAAGRSIE